MRLPQTFVEPRLAVVRKTGSGYQRYEFTTSLLGGDETEA